MHALHQRALHGNSVVGNSQGHDISFVLTVLTSATCCSEVSTVSRILPLAANPQNLAPCISQPCPGISPPIHQTTRGQDSHPAGPLDPPSRDLLGYRNCQVKRRHSFSLPLQHLDIDHIITSQRFRNNCLVIPVVDFRSVTLHARLELNGCLALAFRDPGQKALRVTCRSVGERNTSTFIQKHLAWR